MVIVDKFTLELSDGLCYNIILKEIIMTCGIYLGSPKSNTTDKVYVGLSVNIEERVRRHNSDLRAGNHNYKLQEAYNIYGEFCWEIIEECPEEVLEYKEEYYIKLFNSTIDGFNTYHSAYDAPILHGVDNGKVSPEYILLCGKILRLTIDNPLLPREAIANMLGTYKHVVAHIWYGKSKWLLEYYPLEYQEVLALLGNRQVGGKSAKQQGIIYPTILSPDLIHFNVENVREFAKLHGLDYSDLNNTLNMKVASVKGWIIKDLDIINPEAHAKFSSHNRGHYTRQYALYKNSLSKGKE